MRWMRYFIDTQFSRHWKHYLFQSLLATASIFAVLLLFQIRALVIVASIGASLFIIFALPSRALAQPRNVLGGHFVGLLCGTLVSFIPAESLPALAAAYAAGVGLSVFIMVVTNTEHPPASGTALAIAHAGFSWESAVALLGSLAVLMGIKFLFRKTLRDLL